MPTKLTAKAVAIARRARKVGMTYAEMERMSGVNRVTWASACRGHTWASVDMWEWPVDEETDSRRGGLLGRRSRQARLTDDQVREIRRRHREGERARSLAREYGYSEPGMSYILRGISYANVGD